MPKRSEPSGNWQGQPTQRQRRPWHRPQGQRVFRPQRPDAAAAAASRPTDRNQQPRAGRLISRTVATAVRGCGADGLSGRFGRRAQLQPATNVGKQKQRQPC